MRPFALPAVAVLVTLASSGCGSSSTECSSAFVAPELRGTFEVPIVTFKNVDQLYLCVGSTCGAKVAERTSIVVEERPAEAKPAVDSGIPDSRGPGTVTVRYDTSPAPTPVTGDVLRIRYPGSPTGPWTIDISMRAEVTAATECAPAYGTLTRVP
jgi:hypothetical protein